jgi:predicted deacylase
VANKSSLIWTDIDYDREGKQVGWLHLPHSVTRSAYGTLAIPIAVIRNGAGPTVLLTAGNHGDEYEGQIALCKLIRSLEPGRIKGRVIALPALNFPAAMAGERVSPIDGGNLNRAFIDEPDRGPTWAIAHYVEHHLYRIADITHDLHSGGSSLDYLCFASLHVTGVPAIDAKARAALAAFAAPIAIEWPTTGDGRFAGDAARRAGIPYLSGEFAGGGAVDREAVKVVEAGLRRLLGHLGIAEPPKEPPPPPSRRMRVPAKDGHVYAPAPGLFEPATVLGDTVEAGDLCGRVHFVDDPARAPVEARFKGAGMVICKRRFGRVERGDCVAHLAVDEPG